MKLLYLVKGMLDCQVTTEKMWGKTRIVAGRGL